MSKLTKIKEIDAYKPRLESIYEKQKNDREQAILNAKNCDPKLKKVVKYDLKR